MKHGVQVIILVVLLTLVTSAVLWANHCSQAEVCKSVDVLILNSDDQTFVTGQGILHELEMNNIYPKGKLVASVNTDSIERVLNRCDYLNDAECFVADVDHLVITVNQFEPVMRVYDRGDGSVYYVNRNGKKMQVDGRYHIDVPVVEGDFTGSFKPLRLLPLIDYVERDSSLTGIVSMYTVRDSNNVCFVPSICGHIVNVGDMSNIDSKFKKLKLFYDKVMPYKGWDAYTEVSLKWDYQVVGTLRSKKSPYFAPYNPEEDEQAPSIESVGIENDSKEPEKSVKPDNDVDKVVEKAFSKN